MDNRAHSDSLFITEDNKLKVKKLNLKDITISGSNVSYGYSEYSDIDLHLIVDFPEDEELRDYFNSKKNEFNNKYDFKLKGIEVEVYNNGQWLEILECGLILPKLLDDNNY